MRREQLFFQLTTEEEAIGWCQKFGILNSGKECYLCGSKTEFNKKQNKNRCINANCRIWIYLKANTAFHDSNLPIRKLILLLYEWSIETSVSTTAYEYELSISTVSEWFKKFRKLASLFYLKEKSILIGGEGLTVEIDECYIVKRKYNRGRMLRNTNWIFGGIVRGNNTECFIEFVEERNRKTLHEVISRRINPGSIICSDNWKAYGNLVELLPEMKFKGHKKVNHSKNFVNPEDPEAHTQNIEAFWSMFKRKLKKCGGEKYGSQIEDYFGQIMYKKLHRSNTFEKFIEDLEFTY